ncbi:hypothetical protein WEI85_00590 [Actinomycetes bacterium KLBMP 9797]
MADITLHDPEPEFAVARDEDGDVTLTIRADHTSIRISVGRCYDSASLLGQSLQHLAEDVDKDVLDGWEDTPDEYDAYISVDRGRYHVSLEGTPVGDYPSQDVAEIELARAMVDGGVFPNAWFINERGNYHTINDSIRRWHDEGGDGMAPIEGVQYQPGDRVRYTGIDWPCVVVADWGTVGGVEIHTDGDPTIRAHVTDRTEMHPITD